MSRVSQLDQNVGAAGRKTTTKKVVCGQCGETFNLSHRNEYGARMRGEAPVCWSCRFPPKPISPAKLEELKRWWRDRYSPDELREIAFGLWPSLVASTVDATNGPEGHRIDSPVLGCPSEGPRPTAAGREPSRAF